MTIELTSNRTTTISTTLQAFNRTKRSLSESSAEELQRYEEKVNGSYNRKTWQNDSIVKPTNENIQPKRKQSNGNICDSITAAAAGNSYSSNNRHKSYSNAVDVAIRVILVFVFIKLEITNSFKRTIHLEELWLYKNPRTPDIVSPQILIIAVIFGPFLTTLLQLLLTGDRRDFRAASWTWTLGLCLNGLATSLLKITIGRPRPDFFYRCFPDGVIVLKNNLSPIQNDTFDMFNCTGSLHDINEGRKSFPSGHSSFAFVGFGFISFYIGSKLQAFSPNGRGQSWRLCISLAPLLVAALVAISRTCDYHHHWEDVLVGGIIGFFISYFVYRQYYPSIFSRNCQRPYYRSYWSKRKNSYKNLYSKEYSSDKDENHPLIGDNDVGENEENKWI